MKSDKQKGAERVREFDNLVLKKLGYITWKPGNKAIWIKDKKTGKVKAISSSQDIFEVADIIGIRKDRKVLLVQVTTFNHTLLSERRKKFDKLVDYINPETIDCIVVGRHYKKRSWHIYKKVSKYQCYEWEDISLDIDSVNKLDVFLY